MAFKVAIENWAGEMVSETVESEDETRLAAVRLVSGIGSLVSGDKLVVTETNPPQG